MPPIRRPYSRTATGLNLPVCRYKNQPLLTVGLRGSNKQLVKVLSYIDTGAQCCFFDKQYAKFLGIANYKATKVVMPIQGIGGTAPQNIAYFHEVVLLVYKNQDKPDEGAYEIKTMIGFLEKEICVAGVLGVCGFLDHFAFVANVPKGYFELNPQFDD